MKPKTKATAKLAKQLSGGEKSNTKVNVKIDPALQALPNACENSLDRQQAYKPCNKPAELFVRGLQGDKWRMCKACALEVTQRYSGYISGPFKKEGKK